MYYISNKCCFVNVSVSIINVFYSGDPYGRTLVPRYCVVPSLTNKTCSILTFCEPYGVELSEESHHIKKPAYN